MKDHIDGLDARSAPNAEPSAIEEDNFLGRVLDTLAVFVGILSPNGILLAANEAPLKAASLTKDDVLGRPFWDCYWWSHDPAVQERLRAAIDTAGRGERVHYDENVRTADGSLLPIGFSLAPMRDRAGEVTYIVASGIDLSDRREIEAESQSRSAELETIYRTAPVGLCVIDADSRFLRVNQRLAEINGLPVEAHLGRTVREVVPSLADQAESMVRRVIATRQPISGLEIVGETPAQPGRQRVWRENWEPIVDSETGTVHGVNVVALEITDWKQAEERLRESEAQARALAEQRELLLHELSHRVKNSLALIASMLALQRRHLTGSAADALADAHRRILAIAKVHENLYSGTTGDRIDLVAFAETLLSETCNLHPAVTARVEAAGPASLTVDRAVSFGLLLNELVVNALKHAFAPAGAGRITVSIGPERGGRLSVTVADDGAGMPDALLLESGGLGSRLIHGLTEQLGATIEMRSAPGQGTRFDLAIPSGAACRPDDADTGR